MNNLKDAQNIFLDIRGVHKSFSQGGENLTILQDVDLQIKAGEIVALVGPSGSGKSTLLQIAGLLDKPSTGNVLVDGQTVALANDNARTKTRRNAVGFIYQFHYLLPEFSALENVVIPQMIAGQSKKKAQERAKKLLDQLKLSHRLDHRPAQLSGGEQQRVAIARALANHPKLILADEPTGNLDPETSETVFEMLVELVRSQDVSALVATHNHQLAEKMDRILELKQGRLIEY